MVKDMLSVRIVGGKDASLVPLVMEKDISGVPLVMGLAVPTRLTQKQRTRVNVLTAMEMAKSDIDVMNVMVAVKLK